MEMEGVQQSGMAHSPYPAQTVTVIEPEQQHQHHQDEPSPSIKLPPVSPATSPGTGAPLHGAAPPTVQQSVQPEPQPQPEPPAGASPGARSGTPHSASQPSTPSGLSLHPPRLPLPLAHIAGASLQAAANAAINAAAHHHNAATHAKAQGQDHLRWRDPITVQYDAGGHPHPLAGKLSNQPSPQLSSVHLPPVVTLTHQQQQHQHQQTPQQQTVQFGQSGGYHAPRASHQPQQAIAPLPIALQQQQHQHQHQHPQQQQPPHQNPPLANSHPPPAHAHASLHPNHNHILNINHQHQHQQPTPPPSHHQFHHHQPPPAAYSSKPALLPSLPSLPPIALHQPPSLAAHVAPSPIFPTSGGHTTPVHQVVSKPPIMDPPRRASQTAAPPPAGFPSPLQDYARTNSKFVDDCTRLTFAVQQSLPESVRRIIRDNWQKCLLGSEFHQAFIVSRCLPPSHSLPRILRAANFGDPVCPPRRVRKVAPGKSLVSFLPQS